MLFLAWASTQRSGAFAFGDQSHPMIPADVYQLVEVGSSLDLIRPEGPLLEKPVRGHEPALAVDHGSHDSRSDKSFAG